MTEFKVVSIVDGDTFDVDPGWKWNSENGKRIRPTGYDAAEIGSRAGQLATEKLAGLILNQKVELRKAHRVDRGRLVCDVFFQGRDLASYFG